MPELPEVETVRKKLAHAWEGRSITQVDAVPHNYFFVTRPHILRKKLLGLKAKRVHRHGKYIICQFQDESRLLLHLGMTGQFVVGSLPQDGHVHLVLHLGKKSRISLRDVRKFGKVEFIAPGQSSPRLDKLGPDALIVEEDRVQAAFKKRSLAIKSALLDQSILAGVGNIYADEALFAAGIRPTKAAKRLTRAQSAALLNHVKRILNLSICQGGSTINDYMQADGKPGAFQDWHQVYGKGGAPCPRCSIPLERIVVGGRSTHFCKNCQS